MEYLTKGNIIVKMLTSESRTENGSLKGKKLYLGYYYFQRNVEHGVKFRCCFLSACLSPKTKLLQGLLSN